MELYLLQIKTTVQKSINKQTTVNSWQIDNTYYQNGYFKIKYGKVYVNGYVYVTNSMTGKTQKGAVYAQRAKITPLNSHVKIKKVVIRSIGWPSGKFYYNTYTYTNHVIAPGKNKGFDRFTVYYTIS
ncbi:MAG: hypothetical protein NKF70_10155 [Methanobacterium sp. ERen5]|nr:MAG: hypothetical protein NKF70_10155 [Methanobacterium sp. ERen5]